MILKQVQSLTKNHPLRSILIFGILLRVIVWCLQSPFNNDHHFEIIEYIYTYHSFPLPHQLEQAYQPPLYYLLASLLFPFGGKAIQTLSLLFSIGSLTIIYYLIKKLDLFTNRRTKQYCLLFACLLPQFIMFGNYISNDSLAFFIGGLLQLQAYLYLKKASLTRLILLAAILGLGLLTKATFVFFIPIFMALLIITNLQKRVSLLKHLSTVLLFTSLVLIIGGYKYAENQIHYMSPIVHNIDTANPPWVQSQKGTYQGISSLIDINIFKLLLFPTISEKTKHSYPLLFYATFWYQYIPESNFKGNMSLFKYIGSFIYILAVIPTFLFFLGLLQTISSIKQFCLSKIELVPHSLIFRLTSVTLLAVNFTIVFLAGIKYDVWSCFQARLLFPSFFSFIVLFNDSLDWIKSKQIKNILYINIRYLYTSFILYFIIEIIINLLVAFK